MKQLKILLIAASVCFSGISMAATTDYNGSSNGAGIHIQDAGELSTTTLPNNQSVLFFQPTTPIFSDLWTLIVGADESATIQFQTSNAGNSSGLVLGINPFDVDQTASFNGPFLADATLLGSSRVFSGLTDGTFYFKVTGTNIGSSGGQYSVTTSVSAVPVPAAVWLLGSAMLGLVSFGKRKKSA